MTVTVAEFKKIQRDIKQLQRRMAKLEMQKAAARSTSRKRAKRTAPQRPPRVQTPKSNQEIIELLKSKGMIRDLTPEEKRIGEEWRALPEEEKEKVNQALQNIRLDQTVAELIAEVRS